MQCETSRTELYDGEKEVFSKNTGRQHVDDGDRFNLVIENIEQ